MHSTKAVRGVLVVGALASVATSQAPERWGESKDQSIAFQMDGATASKTYAIVGELRGPGPFVALEGLAQVYVRFSGAPSPNGNIKVTLRSLTDPNLMPDISVGDIVAGQSNFYLDLPAWTTCTEPPCDSAFELVFERDIAMGGPIVDVAVTIYLDAAGDGYPTPRGTELVLSVTGP